MPKGVPSAGTHAQHATLLMHLKCCNFRPAGPFGASPFVLGASWMGLQAHFRIATGCHERYTARAGAWPAAGPEAAAGTSAAQSPVREIAAERLIFDRSDQQKPNPRQSHPLGSSPAHLSGTWGGRWSPILGHLLAILRTTQNISDLGAPALVYIR
jgi:hypothetical protein